MKLHLGTHLSWYAPGKASRLDIPLPEPTSLTDLLAMVGLPRGEIAIAAVNGTLVPLENTQVLDSDQVELYPPVDGG